MLSQNKKARHDYFVEETYEAGLVLQGTEVKSIRLGRSNLKDSYAYIKSGEVFVANMHVSPYEMGSYNNADPLRERKLLLNKKEIRKLDGLTSKKGYTLVPLSLYLKNGRVKMELAVAIGKKLYDKRESIAERDAKRSMDRQMKDHGGV